MHLGSDSQHEVSVLCGSLYSSFSVACNFRVCAGVRFELYRDIYPRCKVSEALSHYPGYEVYELFGGLS